MTAGGTDPMDVVLGGDWNAQWDALPFYQFSLQALAKHGILADDVRIIHIDGFMVVNGRVRDVERLEDKFGSDAHRPVVADVVAK